MQVDLRQVLRSARRWWWVIVLCPALLGAGAYMLANRQEPQFQAQAKLFVDPSGTGTLDYNTLLSAERLTKAYQKLVENRAVLTGVITALQLDMDESELAAKISSTAEGDTQLLIVAVTDADPDEAARIANEVANQFASYVRDQSTSSGGTTLSQLEQAVADIQAEISTVEARIAELEASANAADPEVQKEIDSLNATLDQLRPTAGSLTALLIEARGRAAVAVDRVRVAEPAFAPTLPFAPRPLVNAVLGVMAGMIIAGGLLLILSYLDNTVKSTADFNELAGGPLLAAVNSVPKVSPGRQQLFVLEHPKSAAAESIRLLRTNIEFASATREIATLGITSPNPGEGKSTVASNLAVTLAQAGFVTALIDADLRRPTQHRVFETGNERGLSTLLTMVERDWTWAARESKVPNLMVIPAGPLPPNPADLLSLERLRQILGEMRSHFDVIVIDTPPVLAVSDPLIIAAHVDGMLIVTRGGKTRIDALRRASETLQRGAIRIIGVVINQQAANSKEGYYYTDYHAVEEKIGTGMSRKGRSAAKDLALPKVEQGSSAD